MLGHSSYSIVFYIKCLNINATDITASLLPQKLAHEHPNVKTKLEKV